MLVVLITASFYEHLNVHRARKKTFIELFPGSIMGSLKQSVKKDAIGQHGIVN